MKTLLNIDKCPRYAWYSSLELRNDSSDRRAFKHLIIEEINKNGFAHLSDEAYMKNVLLQADDRYFSIVYEKQAKAEIIAARLFRMAMIFTLNGFEFIGESTKKSLFVNGKEVTVSADFFVKQNGVKYAVKLVLGASTHTYMKTKNFVGNSVSFYGMWRAFPDCMPAEFALQQKTEKAGDFPTEHFPYTIPKKWDGKNWFAYNFDENGCAEAEARFYELVSTPLNAHSEKNTKECRNCPFAAMCNADEAFMKEEGEILDENLPHSADGSISFTEEQQRVINFREGEARVLACAGSGKTTTIAARTANLVKTGVEPEKILMITFTDKGSREMKEKLRKVFLQGGLVPDDADRIPVFTFNRFGNELIMKYWNQLGFTEKPTVITDTKKIIFEILNKNDKIPGANYINPLLDSFNTCGVVTAFRKMAENAKKNSILETKDYMALYDTTLKNSGIVPTVNVMAKIADMIQQYFDILKERNLIVYEDQINYGIKLAEEGAAPEFSHIMIDEFQDTSEKEMRFAKLLYHPGIGKSLMVIGDDNQGIFSFRGVGIENIVNFHDTFPGAVDLPLSLNFRSTSEIVNEAEKVIALNQMIQVPKEMKATKSGGKVIIRETEDKEKAAYIAAECCKEREGESLSGTAVLARTRTELNNVAKELGRMKIPYYFSIAEYYKEDIQMQAIAGLSDFISTGTNMTGLAAWLRMLNPEKFDASLNPTDYVATKGQEIKDEFTNLSNSEKYEKFISLITSSIPSPSRPVLQFLESEQDPVLTRTFTRLAETLDELTNLYSDITSEADESKRNAVSLSTIHSAKGREWDKVIFLTHGSKALKNAGKNRVTIDPEEIRLLFVGVTRAKKKLIIITPESLRGLF